MKVIIAGLLCLAPCTQAERPVDDPMVCDGEATDPYPCSAAGGETVCDTQPELCEP